MKAHMKKKRKALANEIDANNKTQLKLAMQETKGRIDELNDLLDDFNEIFIESFLKQAKSEPFKEKTEANLEEESPLLEKPKISLKSKNDVISIFTAMQSSGIIGAETIPDQIAQIFFDETSDNEAIKFVSTYKSVSKKISDGWEANSGELSGKFILELCKKMSLGELVLLQKELSELIKKAGGGIVPKTN